MISALRNMPLSRKILLPFFAFLLLLGMTATLGSTVHLYRTLSQSAGERLASAQMLIYQEIKQQENLLLTFGHLLEYTQSVIGQEGNRESAILLDNLYRSLEHADVTVAYFPPDLIGELPYPSLRKLLDQAERSRRPRFRFAADAPSPASLSVAFPTFRDKRVHKILLLQTKVGTSFLQRLTGGTFSRIAFLSIEGEVIVTSEKGMHTPPIDAALLEELLTGKAVSRKIQSDGADKIVLYQAIPLGTTDMIISAVDMPADEMNDLMKTLAHRSLLTLLITLAVGGLLYSRLIRQTMAPVRRLLLATKAVSEGNLAHRIETRSGDELGQLADSFNQMTERLQTLYNENITRTRELTQAQDALQYKAVLETKNAEIEKTNRELQTRLRELSALFQLNQAMISTLDLNQLFERIFAVLQGEIDCDRMILLLYTPGSEDLEVRKAAGVDSKFTQDMNFRLNEGISGHALRRKETVYLPDLDEDYPRLGYKAGSLPAGSLVCSPMMVKNRLSGLLLIFKKERHAFSAMEVQLVAAVGNQAAIAVENARLYEKSRSSSTRDELTGLAARRYFHEILRREMAQSRRYGIPLSILLGDIDQFKGFNDTFGQLAGDRVLKEIAQILLQNTRGIDLVGRFGGEEFAILLPKTERLGAYAVAEKLRQAVASATFLPRGTPGPASRVTLSVGIAEFPSDSTELYELLDRADRALFRAKESGRNRTVAWPDASRSVRDVSCPPEISGPGVSPS